MPSTTISKCRRRCRLASRSSRGFFDWVNSHGESAGGGGTSPGEQPGGAGAGTDLGKALGLDAIGGGGAGSPAGAAAPQRFSGGGGGGGHGWDEFRPIDHVEDRRRAGAIREDTQDRETNSKLLKQVNEKLFQLLNPPGGPAGGGAAALAWRRCWLCWPRRAELRRWRL